MGGKTCSCDVLWSRPKQFNNSNDVKLVFDSIFKLVAVGLLETFPCQSLVMRLNMHVQFLSADVPFSHNVYTR